MTVQPFILLHWESQIGESASLNPELLLNPRRQAEKHMDFMYLQCKAFRINIRWLKMMMYCSATYFPKQKMCQGVPRSGLSGEPSTRPTPTKTEFASSQHQTYQSNTLCTRIRQAGHMPLASSRQTKGNAWCVSQQCQRIPSKTWGVHDNKTRNQNWLQY